MAVMRHNSELELTATSLRSGSRQLNSQVVEQPMGQVVNDWQAGSRMMLASAQNLPQTSRDVIFLVIWGILLVGAGIYYAWSVAFVAKDAGRRGASYLWVAIVAFMPVFGMLLWMAVRPRPSASDRGARREVH